MTHLRIELNQNVEVITTALFKELYNLVKSSILDDTSNFAGNIQVPHCTLTAKKYMEERYPLTINCTDGYYIDFEDPVVEQICATNWGDGVGITQAQAAAVTSLDYAFRDNALITKFDELKYFTKVTLLDGYYGNNNGEFHNCTNLKSIDLINVTNLGRSVFYGCSSLEVVKNFHVLDLKSEGRQFYLCTSLVTIDLSNTAVLDSYAFYGCTKLNDINNLKKITRLSSGTLYDCTNFNVILDMPSLSNLSDSSFGRSGITGIENLGNISQIPNGSEYSSYIPPNWYIGCFSRCKLLKYVILPSSLTHIGTYAFYYCSELEYTKLSSTTPPSLGETDATKYGFPFYGTTCTFYVPDESLEDYKAAAGWSAISSRIKPMSEFATDFPNE